MSSQTTPPGAGEKEGSARGWFLRLNLVLNWKYGVLIDLSLFF